ncbi:MAG: hypothetical protein QOG91_262 [Candidatus Parcubacteria bacterium]|jgi:SAM-dependent methyltransferase|nr:hypothetical protein [Candidatus Parcubacteria bacterium]
MGIYDRKFFSSHAALSYASAQRIVPLITALIHPRSVVDVGCGTGSWLRVFREKGITEILGIDGDYVQKEQLEIPASAFMTADLERPLSIGRVFDLAISLEVAEHLDQRQAEAFIFSLVALSPAIIFSAAVPGQGGTSHKNEQWPEYWRQIFKRHGYVVTDPIRMEVWDDGEIAWWYAQNIFVYVREDALERFPALEKYRAKTARALVHPKLLQKSRMSLPQKISRALRNMFQHS